MLKGTTESGFIYEIPEGNLNNFELVEAISNSEENPLAIAKVVNWTLGKEQAQRFS